jgi:23S rRNA U2552 (ribose-2'-O)-methylase RlmE/FtsJ
MLDQLLKKWKNFVLKVYFEEKSDANQSVLKSYFKKNSKSKSKRRSLRSNNDSGKSHSPKLNF